MSVKAGSIVRFLSILSCKCSHSPPPLCALQLNSEVKLAKKELKRAQTIMQLDELKCRKRVLRRWEGRKEGGGREEKGREGRGRERKRRGTILEKHVCC